MYVLFRIMFFLQIIYSFVIWFSVHNSRVFLAVGWNHHFHIFHLFNKNGKSVRLYKLSQYPDEDLSNVLFLHRLSLIFFSLQLYCCITGKESYYCHFSNTDSADKVPFTYSIYVLLYRYFQNGVYRVKRLPNRSLKVRN